MASQAPEVRQLLLQVDASVELLRRNLTDAERTLDSFTRKGEQSAQRFDRAMKQTVISTGQLRAGAQQLSFQLADVATSLASGARPLQVFAQQSTQVIQAIGLMTNSTKGFVGFIGGPWGVALTAGITLLASFGSRLFEASDASKQATVGANALADAQGVLGQVFDATSGRIKTQNELLLANARLTASNLRADALAKRTSATNLANSAQRDFAQSGSGILATRGLELLTGQSFRSDSSVSKLIRDVDSGALTAEQALRFADTFDLRGTGVDRNQLRQAIVDLASARDAENVAGLIDQSLRSGTLAPGLRESRTTRTRTRRTRTKSDPFADYLGNLRTGSAASLDGINFVDPQKATADASRRLYGSLGLDPLADFQKILGEAEKRRDVFFEGLADKWQEQQGNVSRLADFYLQAFQGGTRAIFRDFKQLGLAAVAEILARFTIAQFRGGGPGLDFGSIAGSVLTRNFSGFGFANGGNPPVGKASIVGERGPELFIPSVPGRIIPNNALGGRMAVEVVASPYFDVRVREVATPVASSIGQAATLGGATLAQQRSAKASSRRLGR